MGYNNIVHVAVAVIRDSDGRVLLSRRSPDVHQGDLWEFPGGKLEPGEEIQHALRRECREELGIEVLSSAPLIRVPYQYPDKAVLLDVHEVVEYQGTPHGREGQPVTWSSPGSLGNYPLPAANLPIIRAVQLPAVYAITPEPAADFLVQLKRLLDTGIRLLQFRSRHLPQDEYIAMAAEVVTLCHAVNTRVLLNCDPQQVQAVGADGVHLTQQRSLQLQARPLAEDKLVAASCHDAESLQHAAAIGVDFAVLSPVRHTSSHPDSPVLGWQAFHTLVDSVALPVYALGGMDADDTVLARQHGGQGIAAISSLWPAEDQ
jgi:8-oxo-dGTP diphosphatase